MAGRFQFSSPGAAFSSELTKIMAERKAEERQRLLDSLALNADQRAEQAAQRQEADQREQVRMNNASLESAAFTQERQKQSDLMAQLAALTANKPKGWQPDEAVVDPALLEAGDKFGVWNRRPVSEASTAEIGPDGTPRQPVTTTVTPKTYREYAGTREEQEKDRRKSQLGAMVMTLMQSSDPRKHEIAAAMKSQLDATDEVSPQLLALLGPNTPVNVIDPRSNKITPAGSVSPGSENIMKPQPVYHPPQRDTEVRVNTDGYMVYQRPNGTTYVDTSQKFPTQRDPSEGPLGIPATMYNAHLMRVDTLEPDSDGKVDPAVMRGFRQSAANIISKANVTPKVKNLASMWANNANSYNEQLKQVQLTDREVEQLQDLKIVVATPEVEEILAKNPVISVKPTVKPAPAAATKTPTLEEIMSKKIPVGKKGITLQDIFNPPPVFGPKKQ